MEDGIEGRRGWREDEKEEVHTREQEKEKKGDRRTRGRKVMSRRRRGTSFCCLETCLYLSVTSALSSLLMHVCCQMHS